VQDYRDLRVWKKAHALTLDVRRASYRFPRSGFASLKSQLTRAAESVPFNIVEGCGASTGNEMARFLDIAIKSTMELEYQLTLAKDYEVLSEPEWHALDSDTVEVRKMLCGLRAKVLAREATEAAVTENA
jgi:four helix bundle protein